MKPNPLASLNHFTGPCHIVFSSVLICCHAQSNWGSGRIFAETKLVPMQGVCILAPSMSRSLQGVTCGRVRADKIDPEWSEHARERWIGRPADVVVISEIANSSNLRRWSWLRLEDSTVTMKRMNVLKSSLARPQLAVAGACV